VMQIRCRGCGHEKFSLHFRNGQLDRNGQFLQGELAVTCLRCGGHTFGALDPLEEQMLRGSIVPT